MDMINIKIHGPDGLVGNARFPRGPLKRITNLNNSARKEILDSLCAGDFRAPFAQNEGGNAYLLNYSVGKLMPDADVTLVAPTETQTGTITIPRQTMQQLVGGGYVFVNDLGLPELNVECDADEELKLRLQTLIESGKTEREAKEIVLNNFYFKLPGNTTFRAAMLADALPGETMAQRSLRLYNAPLDLKKHSQRFSEKTCEQFFADIDRALRTSGIDKELFLVGSEPNTGLGDKRNPAYVANVERIYEAYQILRSIGYTWNDLCG